MADPSSDFLIPVGFSVGYIPWGGSDQFRPAVRLGGEILALTGEMQDMWWQARYHMSAEGLLRWAAQDEHSDPEESLDELQDTGLLFVLSRKSVDSFASGHRILPTGIGTGFDSTTGLYLIRDHSMNPLLAVDPLTYSVWTMSDGIMTIDTVCQFVASQQDLDYHTTLLAIAGAVPGLVESNVIAIDRAADYDK